MIAAIRHVVALASASALALAPLVAACSDRQLRAQGEECVASSECELGLVCDFQRDPPVCAPTQTAGPDAAPDDGEVDAAVADRGADASSEDPDAPVPDAEPPPPDAEVPDAEAPDAEAPDAEAPDAETTEAD